MAEHIDEWVFYEYLDEVLDAAAAQSVATHLASCPSCQEQLARQKRLFATLGSLPEAPLTIDLTPKVMGRLRPQPKPFLPGWWRWVLLGEGIAAAALLLLLLPTIRPLIGGVSFTFPAAEISNQLLRFWVEMGSVLTLTWPASSLNSAVPFIIWAVILGLGILVGLIGNSLLLPPLLRSLSPTPHRGQHA